MSGLLISQMCSCRGIAVGLVTAHSSFETEAERVKERHT